MHLFPGDSLQFRRNAVGWLFLRVVSWPLFYRPRPRLLHRYVVEFPRTFLVKQCAFRFVAPAPMFVTTGNE